MTKGDFKSMIGAYQEMKNYHIKMTEIANKLKPYIEALIEAEMIEKEKSYNIDFDVIVKDYREILISPQVIKSYKKEE